MSEEPFHEEPPLDPNAPRYDTIEGRVVTRAERKKENARGRGLLIGGAIAFVPVLILILLFGNRLGNGAEAMYIQAERPVAPQTALLYIDPHHQFAIVVQRINPGLHQETDFRVTVYTTVAHKPGVQQSYVFEMSAMPPADGKTFILHCYFHKKYFPLAAALILASPMNGQIFSSGGRITLALGRDGSFPLMPATPAQVSAAVNTIP